MDTDPTRPVLSHPRHGMYFDPCHPHPWRQAAWHGLALVFSLVLWFALGVGAIALLRRLLGA